MVRLVHAHAVDPFSHVGRGLGTDETGTWYLYSVQCVRARANGRMRVTARTMADHDHGANQQSLESTLMSDDSQLNTSDITSQRMGHFEHRLLWNSDESAQVIILCVFIFTVSAGWQLPDNLGLGLGLRAIHNTQFVFVCLFFFLFCTSHLK